MTRLIDVTKQIADIVVQNRLVHYGGVHTIPTIGDPGKHIYLVHIHIYKHVATFLLYFYVILDAEPNVQKKFALTYGAVKEFACRDFEPVHISVPAGHQMIIFSATYGSRDHPDNDVTWVVANRLVKGNVVSLIQ